MKSVKATIYWGSNDFEVEWDNPKDGAKVEGRVIITKVEK